MNEPRSLDYAKGFADAVAMMRPAQILTLNEANELLKRCETCFEGRPNNVVTDFKISPEMLHELLIVWKTSR